MDKCPKCNSRLSNWGGFKLSGKFITVAWKCFRCNLTFYDYKNLFK